MTGHNNHIHTLSLLKSSRLSAFLDNILQPNGSYFNQYKVKWVKCNTLRYTESQIERSNDFSSLCNLMNE